MGQAIRVEEPTVIGDVALFSTDRGLTGQAGAAFDRSAGGDTFPGRLATEVFAVDDAIRHVGVASNQVTAQRDGGWDPPVVSAVTAAIERFFVFYD